MPRHADQKLAGKLQAVTSPSSHDEEMNDAPRGHNQVMMSSAGDIFQEAMEEQEAEPEPKPKPGRWFHGDEWTRRCMAD